MPYEGQRVEFDMLIYKKRRLWRRMSESRMSNFTRAIRFSQTPCFFVARILIFKQETMLLCPVLKFRGESLYFAAENACRQAMQYPV